MIVGGRLYQEVKRVNKPHRRPASAINILHGQASVYKHIHYALND